MDVKTAARTLDLFEAFAAIAQPASVTQLSRHLGIPVSSCFSLVKTLEAHGYLYPLQDRGPWYPTGQLLRVASEISASDPVSQEIFDAMEVLRDEFDETVVLGVLRGPNVLYLHVFESSRPVRYAPRIGEQRPAHANSIGKAILSQLPDKEFDALASRMDFTKLTPNTLASRDDLEESLGIGNEIGWFTNLGESTEELGAVACPLSANGYLFGLSVAGPLNRIRGVPPDTIGARIKSICAELSGPLPNRR